MVDQTSQKSFLFEGERRLFLSTAGRLTKSGIDEKVRERQMILIFQSTVTQGEKQL